MTIAITSRGTTMSERRKRVIGILDKYNILWTSDILTCSMVIQIPENCEEPTDVEKAVVNDYFKQLHIPMVWKNGE